MASKNAVSAAAGSAAVGSAAVGSAAGIITKPAASSPQRFELTGTLLVSDDFARVRLLLVDTAPDGARDSSAWRLRHACDMVAGAGRVARPYELNVRPDSDGSWGVCTIVAPKRFRDHWRAEAARLRGQRVRVTVSTRRYNLHESGPAAGSAAGSTPGISLDLVEMALADSKMALADSKMALAVETK